MRRRDPYAPLLRALADDAARHGLALTPCDVAERSWASATFVGCRLTIVVGIDGGDPARWLADLPEAQFALAGRLVADLVVRAADRAAATLEVLLLEA